MKATAKALKTFAGGFTLPAYALGTVPQDVNAPYLVYPLIEPEWNQKATWYIQGWYRTTSYAELTAKADQIIKEVGTGITISTESGYLVIYPETPLCQISRDGDYTSFYLNFSINVFQMPGAYPETPSQSQQGSGTATQEPGNTAPEEGE